MIHSTRSNKEVTFEYAINKGLSSDKGLFVFDNFPTINLNDILNLNYHDLMVYVLSRIINDYDFNKIIDYPTFDIKVKTFDKYAYLELFHGPTASFKDVALTFLPKLLKKGHIFVATSGDTGSAALSGFSVNENIDVTVLYPNNLVSELQEKQMLYYSVNGNQAFAYKGNFDDCQNLVKELSKDNEKLSSANSINIGRLLPQIIYYFYGYINLVNNGSIKLNDKIDVSVPTGNFGNILSCYLAKKMGLPVDKLICACNENNVLYDFINKGIYDKNRGFIKTYSPSMDILVSSNVERLIYYFYKDTKKVNEIYDEFNKTGKVEIKEYKELFKDFMSFYATNDECINEIKEEYKNKKYLIDPHTAIALNAYKKSETNNYTLIVSTASPYKFETAINKANIELNYQDAPLSIKKALENKNQKIVVDRAYVEEYINGKN